MENETQQEQKPKKKRKWLWIILGIFVFIIIIAIAGGGGEKKETTTKETPTIYALNQEVPSGDVVWKVISVRDRGNKLLARDSQYAVIAKDKVSQGKFIEVKLVVENRGKDLATITSPKLLDNQGREFTDISFQVMEWIPENMGFYLLENLQPNLPKELIAFFEVPTDATGLQLKVGVWKPQLINLGL